MAKLMGMGNNLSSVSGALLPCQHSFNPMRCCLRVVKSSMSIPARIHGRLFTHEVRASSAGVVETKPDPVVDGTKLNIRKNILACPICYERLIWNGDPELSLESVARSTLQCSTCRKTYSGEASHLDLTITGRGKVYGDPVAASTEIFRSPLVSFLYERGWRQSFSFWGGFPGPEKEFELIKEYLKPVLGGNIIDASCGSGMFSRLFARSGLFSLVVALDFSESMLQQCYDFIKQEDNFPEENLILVRADISRLPFASSTVDAVHAGAALHCWPSPSAGVSIMHANAFCHSAVILAPFANPVTNGSVAVVELAYCKKDLQIY
ncbi:UNVERIFIED_CONTAM: putative methyltransferase, chloroplastic [Sesamum radiatum]|uniref:Methyltransferase, chloroplastic n=1 Tax=Sesamum radiatum TaxID=300843 RepID=A0AAW2SIT5_SESRA